jgi:hypothetical protein
VELIFRPIEQWHGKLTTNRKRAQFRSSYGSTLGLLDTELRNLQARDVFIQSAFAPNDIRLDGRPRSGSKPSHPGVILTFVSKFGPLQYPCDLFLEWEDNLRAIALSLGHLRVVDRYGVSRRGEQYRGWAQLLNKTCTLVPQEALSILSRFTPLGTAPQGRAEIDAAYREGAKYLHPDRGGYPEEFKRLVAAHEILTQG